MKHAIVFTGTRHGMTQPQAERVRAALDLGRMLLHGCCIGADAEAHAIYRRLRGRNAHIIGFPSTITSQRALSLTDDLVLRDPEHPLKRNRAMVEEAIGFGFPVCVAAPLLMEEELRSGTWATVRYARTRNVPVYLCWPDGTITAPVWPLEDVRDPNTGDREC